MNVLSTGQEHLRTALKRERDETETEKHTERGASRYQIYTCRDVTIHTGL